MVTLIIKKEIEKNWLSITKIKGYKFKITAEIAKYYYKLKKYSVEELKDGEIEWRPATCLR